MKRRAQAGLTLMEVMIAIAIMVAMMTIAWSTISSTSDKRRTFEAYEEHNHELRMALGKMVSDFEHAYLSSNEDQNASHPRTMFVGKSGSRTPEIRFSTLNHQVLWADAKESEQTVVSYVTRANPEHSGGTDLVRREQRRMSNQPPEEEPADYDVIIRDIISLKLEYWNWKTIEWQDGWDTTQSDGQKNFLPARVRITVVTKGTDGKDEKLMTEARVNMTEVLTGARTGGGGGGGTGTGSGTSP